MAKENNNMKMSLGLVAVVAIVLLVNFYGSPPTQTQDQVEGTAETDPLPDEDLYSNCVYTALSLAEECLISNGDAINCKAESEVDLKNCEALR